jgi:hypothetical protein
MTNYEYSTALRHSDGSIALMGVTYSEAGSYADRVKAWAIDEYWSIKSCSLKTDDIVFLRRPLIDWEEIDPDY